MYRAKIGLDKENFPTFAYNYFGVMITLVTVIVSLYIAFSNILYGILQDKCSYIEDYERKGKVYDNLLDQMSGDWSKMISTITIFFLAIIILYTQTSH